MIKNIFNKPLYFSTVQIMDGFSHRQIDKNGRMNVTESLVTKSDVNQYRGSEIIGWAQMGLDADKIYNVYRPAEELKKCLNDFSKIPLLSKHIMDFADIPQRDFWTGSVSNPKFNNKDKAVYCDLSLWDKEQIAEVESGQKKDLSLGYFCEYRKEGGEFDGKKYDLIMQNIVPNHLALVARGRVAGATVFDENNNPKGVSMPKNIKEALKKVLGMLDEDPKALEKKEEEKKDGNKDGCIDAESLKAELGKIGLDEEKLSKVMNLIGPLLKKDEEPKPSAKEEEKPAPAKDADTPEEKEAEKKKVMDAAKKEVMDEFKEIEKAKEAVSPYTGKVALQDSASDYYKLGLQAFGIKLDGVKDEALKSMFEGAAAMKGKVSNAPVMVADEDIKKAQKNMDDIFAKLPSRKF